MTHDIMEKYKLKNDVNVMEVRVENFPDGVGEDIS
jgi:hypothetical protein